MEYRFNEIEKKWQDAWKQNNVYQVTNNSSKPKYYVLDMFPYPSGAGLHVGHPLGYIASDIYSRYKRLKGFNVLHPMGFDSFGLPAEQYAIETGQHPATTTEKNIATFKSQLDKIGFCYDWSREVRTSDPTYYKWTQWIFLEIFNSYFDSKENKARPIDELESIFETSGNQHQQNDAVPQFTAGDWMGFEFKRQQEILMEYRLAFSKYGEVNWCEALGTVLANDEVVNGVSERGGYPVIKKKMRQWYLRITDYAERLLQGLETVDFSDSMKEMQRNWIGKSAGAEIQFCLTPGPSPAGEGSPVGDQGQNALGVSDHFFKTADPKSWPVLKDLSRENRKAKTEAEDILWQAVRNNQLGYKVRRQHVIEGFIIDFAFLNQRILIEVDGGYHEEADQKEYDEARTAFLLSKGYTVHRFSNSEVQNNLTGVVSTVKKTLDNSNEARMQSKLSGKSSFSARAPLSGRRGAGVEAGEGATLVVYTTRPDTIFGVDFMVVAPELELVQQIKTIEQAAAVDEYIAYVKSRSDVDRMAEKKITGCFTGAYVINPFSGKEIPVWISEYVLAGYGTGAIMAVPCGDDRDFKFAKHFNIPITNIIGRFFNGEEANPTKEATLENSGFLDGMKMTDAAEAVLQKLEDEGIGKRKVNYRMRDAGFSRQRYWGEPFPIIWSNGVALPLDAEELPLELPHVDKYSPGPEGEGPLANIKEWVDLTPNPSPEERGTGAPGNGEPGYFNSTAQEWRNTFPFAKENRKNSTVEENIIWQEIRNRKIDGFKFRRQHPVAGYIPDFICLENKLILEIDGEYHNEEGQQKFDEARENWLGENGFKMLRFTNSEVKNNLKEVVKKIAQTMHLEKELNASGSDSPLHRRGVGGEVKRETSTMPGYAGSSWYFLRYMDPHNTNSFCDRKASNYWNQVDLYIGGTEHAVGHLLYSRLWTKVLFDLGYIGYEEPFKKLLNQGMIQGSSRFVYRVNWNFKELVSSFDDDWPIIYISSIYTKNYSIQQSTFLNNSLKDIIEKNGKEIDKVNLKEILYNSIHVDVNFVNGYELNIEEFKKWKNGENANAEFIPEEDGKYICGAEVEKMSKSKYNTVNPDELCIKYGADTFRMYEMFLGPVEASKPWDTKGIEGVHRFLRKLWRLFFDELKGKVWNEEKANDGELKTLHKTIKKIEEDTERFSFNTAVSTFMICVNELADLKCHKKEILQPLLVLLTPYAPHIAEELYQHLNGNGSATARLEHSVLDAEYPTYNPALLVESSKEYPISINGKVRANITLSLSLEQAEVEQAILQNEIVQKWLEGKAPKKIIYVKNKMVNVVI